MSHDHRVSDENARSYAIKWTKKGPEVVPSGWVVGYTKAHKATPGEAIAYAMEQLQSEITDASYKHDALKMMLEEYRAQ